MVIFVCQERPILLAMPLTMPMGGNWMGQKRSAEGRGSPSCQLWRKPLRGGTLKLEDWWRSWELRWHATLGRRREKLSPICGAEWASCCSAAMLPFSGTGFHTNLGPILMGFYNSTFHCLLTMINVWKPWNTHTTQEREEIFLRRKTCIWWEGKQKIERRKIFDEQNYEKDERFWRKKIYFFQRRTKRRRKGRKIVEKGEYIFFGGKEK